MWGVIALIAVAVIIGLLIKLAEFPDDIDFWRD
jgi:hypothetical protein